MILNLVITVLGVVLIFRLLKMGIFTGNRYKRFEGVLYVKHPGGYWEELSEHQEKYHNRERDR